MDGDIKCVDVDADVAVEVDTTGGTILWMRQHLKRHVEDLETELETVREKLKELETQPPRDLVDNLKKHPFF